MGSKSYDPGKGPDGQSRTRSARKARKSFEIADRRRNVVMLLRSGLDQKEIARELGVSEATISADVDAIKAQWSAHSNVEVGDLVRAELDSLDADEQMIRREIREMVRPDHRLAARKLIVQIQNRRAQLLGLDASHRMKQTAQDGGSNELDALLSDVLTG